MKYKIYKITSTQTKDVYIGKTIHTLNKRFISHCTKYGQCCFNLYDYCSSFQVVCYDDAKIELIEETDDIDREKYWIRKLDCCNYDYNKKPEEYIYKRIDDRYKQGFIYAFEYRHKGTKIRKTGVDYDKLLAWVLDWYARNDVIFD